jgi:hypothetical protein
MLGGRSIGSSGCDWPNAGVQANAAAAARSLSPTLIGLAYPGEMNGSRILPA